MEFTKHVAETRYSIEVAPNSRLCVPNRRLRKPLAVRQGQTASYVEQEEIQTGYVMDFAMYQSLPCRRRLLIIGLVNTSHHVLAGQLACIAKPSAASAQLSLRNHKPPH